MYYIYICISYSRNLDVPTFLRVQTDSKRCSLSFCEDGQQTSWSLQTLFSQWFLFHCPTMAATSVVPASAVSHLRRLVLLGWKDPWVIFVRQELCFIFLRPVRTMSGRAFGKSKAKENTFRHERMTSETPEVFPIKTFPKTEVPWFGVTNGSVNQVFFSIALVDWS